jgi:hypothetical protein
MKVIALRPFSFVPFMYPKSRTLKLSQRSCIPSEVAAGIVVEWDDVRYAGHLREVLVNEDLTHTLSIIMCDYRFARELPSLHSVLCYLKGRADHTFRECFRHCRRMLRGVEGTGWPNADQSVKIFPSPDTGNGSIKGAGFRRPPVLGEHL